MGDKIGELKLGLEFFVVMTVRFNHIGCRYIVRFVSSQPAAAVDAFCDQRDRPCVHRYKLVFKGCALDVSILVGIGGFSSLGWSPDARPAAESAVYVVARLV